MTRERSAVLRKLIADAKEEMWNEDYRDKATESETLGVLISQYFEWDGQRIAQTAFAAFEDSNFHTLSEKFSKLCEEEGLML